MDVQTIDYSARRGCGAHRDLAAQKLILPDGRAVEFPIDSFSKMCLLEGVDELGYMLQQDSAITAYERSRT